MLYLGSVPASVDEVPLEYGHIYGLFVAFRLQHLGGSVKTAGPAELTHRVSGPL